MKIQFLLRIVGSLLLVYLLTQVDLERFTTTVFQTSWLIVPALLMNFPMLLLKVLRWKILLRGQGVQYGLWPAILAYLGSIYLGMLTPGRLGELVKALHVTKDCKVSSGKAFSSVLVDRIFDLYLLLGVGSLALILAAEGNWWTFLSVVVVILGLTGSLALFIWDSAFTIVVNLIGRLSDRIAKIFGPDSWVNDLRQGLRGLSVNSLATGIILTLGSYIFLFCQTYLVALAIGMDISLVSISCAYALGSLVTLLPLSVGGLGTREATIVAYLGGLGIDPETGLGFAFLIFVNFWVTSVLLGFFCWLIKPLPMDQVRRIRPKK